MTQVLATASYVRKKSYSDTAMPPMGFKAAPVEERVWELLETPQTVESLQRAAGDRTQVDRQVIERAMGRLLDADLIELSPDS